MSEKNYLSIESSILYRCHSKYYDKVLLKYGLGYTQMILLTKIYESEGISMNELAEEGAYDKGTITKSIQRLEQLEYVTLENSEDDKRMKLLFTTNKTHNIMPELYKLRSEWNSYLSADINNNDLNTYYDVLDKMVNRAKEYSKAELESNDVRFYGLQKITLLDYPDKVASTIFTGGCNFRCPFCHNKSLVFLNENESEILNTDILDYLRKRNKVLDGVCITGGEPLLYKGIKNFIKEVKELGLKVKLDTNGSNYEDLKNLVEENLIDYVALDIKNSPKKYSETIGLKDFNLKNIEKTKNYLLENHVDYEFRTTIVKEFHTLDDLKEIGNYIKGAKRYFLQNFEDHGTCIQEGLSSVDKEVLFQMKEIVKPYVEYIEIRGVKE